MTKGGHYILRGCAAGKPQSTKERQKRAEYLLMTESDKKLLGDKERRRFFRYTCDASVSSSFEYDAGYLKSKSIGQNNLRVLNLSRGGIALVSQFPVLKEAVVTLKISTAFDTVIRAQARARWSKRLKTSHEAYAVGFEFVKMSREDSGNLNHFLKVLDKSSAKRPGARRVKTEHRMSHTIDFRATIGGYV